MKSLAIMINKKLSLEMLFFRYQFFEKAALPFPSNGPLLCCVNFFSAFQ